MQHSFKAVADSATAAVRLVRGGTGARVVVLRSSATLEPERIHELLAAKYEVILAAPKAARGWSADTLTSLLPTLGEGGCSLVCDAGSAAAALDFARGTPDGVAHLVLVDPQLRPRRHDSEIATPTLILESSRVAEGHFGQQLAAVLRRGYHILIYDAPEQSPTDRAEAAFEVIDDFVERGSAFVLSKPQGALLA